MRSDLSSAARLSVASLFLVAGHASAQQLNESWTVSIGTHIAPVASDGSFLIPNVSAPDLFGAGGPGTAPDFVSDEFVRVVGCGFVDGQMMWAFSDGFQITQGETFRLGQLTMTSTPPPLPVSLSLSLSGRSVLVGNTLQANVIGLLGSGDSLDLSSSSSWTSYKSSNPSILEVDKDGLVTGKGPGLAYVTANNDSVAAVRLVAVASQDDPLTSLSGFTILEGDQTFSGGADVTIVGQPFTTVSSANGLFQLNDVPTLGVESYTVRATQNIGDQLFIGSKTVDVVPGGLSDAGILELKFVEAAEVVFVLDTSGSITSRPVCDLVTTVNAAIAAVAPNTMTTAYGITAQFPGGCSSSSVLSALGGTVPGEPGACGPQLFGNESWGPATAIVAANFPWQTNARVIIPISDEAPCGGGSSCDTADSDSLFNALTVCQQNGVTVLPVMGFGSPGCVKDLAAAIAQGTGGAVVDVELVPAGYTGAEELLTDLILGAIGQ